MGSRERNRKVAFPWASIWILSGREVEVEIGGAVHHDGYDGSGTFERYQSTGVVGGQGGAGAAEEEQEQEKQAGGEGDQA
jgi:hypothetical protein